MREIIFDTETTGLDPLQGHRLVEIGCIELLNHIPTGRTFHAYLNPQREMPSEATMVHGLTDEFLAKQPLFAEVVDDFLTFIGTDTQLVAHNATFDMNFINEELRRTGFKKLPMERAVDTVMIARKMFPGAPASLDALCKRFGVDTSGRQLHGALLDARLLADVYLELRGGRQPDLAISVKADMSDTVTEARSREYRTPRPHWPSADELKAHEIFLAQIKEPLWKRA